MKKSLIFLLLALLCDVVFAKTCHVEVNVCFTPGEKCEDKIADFINKSEYSILVQAYSFTSPLLAKALVDAHHRGVDVQIILDKTQVSQRYSSATYFVNQKVPLWIDNKIVIAHNKVMIIDDLKVITGSYNYTKAAQQRNAENVVFIEGSCIADQYAINWQHRREVSAPVSLYKTPRKLG